MKGTGGETHMTFKKFIAMMKKHDIEIPAEFETDLKETLRNTKSFSQEAYDKHVEGLKKDWVADAKKVSERETLLKTKLESAKVKPELVDKFVKLYDLNDLEGADLDKAIATGIKEMPAFKNIAEAPTSTDKARPHLANDDTATHTASGGIKPKLVSPE